MYLILIDTFHKNIGKGKLNFFKQDQTNLVVRVRVH
jgi:hypothetical protein